MIGYFVALLMVGPGYTNAKNVALLTPSDALVFARLDECC